MTNSNYTIDFAISNDIGLLQPTWYVIAILKCVVFQKINTRLSHEFRPEYCKRVIYLSPTT